MIHKFEIETDGNKYEFNLTDNPLHGKIKEVATMEQIRIIALLKDDITENDFDEKLNIKMQQVLARRPEKLLECSELMDGLQEFKTITLCSDLSKDDLDKLPQSVYITLLKKCEEILGGSAEEYIKKSNAAIMSL